MSYRVTAFTVAQPQPLVLCNYIVQIPKLLTSSILVEAATFPQEKFGEVAVFHRGEPIYFPTRSETGGVWSCRMAENILGTIGNKLQEIKYSAMDAKSRTTNQWLDIFVAPATGFTMVPMFRQAVILRGAWMQTIDDIQLDASNSNTAWKWNAQFRYQYIRPYLLSGKLMDLFNL